MSSLLQNCSDASYEDSDDYIPPTSSDSSISSDENHSKRLSCLIDWKGRLVSSKRKLMFSDDDCPSSSYPKVSEENALEFQVSDQPSRETSPMAIQEIQDTPQKKVRKKVRNSSAWQSTIRKEKHQKGEAYISRRGKHVPERKVITKKDCLGNCKLKCMSKISEDERLCLFKSYYSLNCNEKRHFLVNNSTRSLTSRPKRCGNEKKSRRQFSFKYFLNVKNEEVQVCKNFFLGTLAISQKPIYNAHCSKNHQTNTPVQDGRGKESASRRVPVGNVDFVREHIKSFQKVESHYCRTDTKREYLGSNLSVSKMFQLYVDQCKGKEIEPVKLSQYYKIFVTEFNLGFHIPKGDRCAVCEKHKIASQAGTVDEVLENDFISHINDKNAMRNARKGDKENDNPVLLFDLQNVVTCPHADISTFFYYHKLRIYNLTAYFTVTKTVYCAIWPETMAGRKGNDLASAFKRIVDVVMDENGISSLITWSDSCVPQNRNSIISNAVMHIMHNNPGLNNLTMKYSVPGHSCVQEVDNAHSQIEKAMNATDFFSPVGFIRLMKNVNKKHPFRIIQMKAEDFKDYSSTAKKYNYGQIPYTNIASISFSQVLHEIKYRLSHRPEEIEKKVNIKFVDKFVTRKNRTSKQSKQCRLSMSEFEDPQIEKNNSDIPIKKINDLKKMYPFMPEQDKRYFDCIFKK